MLTGTGIRKERVNGLSITVADALKIGALSSCKLIAGSRGLNRQVSYIDSMEVPNIQPWLKKNLLMVTTGYSIKDDAKALLRLIIDLYKAGAAGLAIKTRFLGEVSENAIRLAERLAIPLIEIPKEIPFVEITMPLMKAIVDEHNNNMEFSERMNQKFLELELNNGGTKYSNKSCPCPAGSDTKTAGGKSRHIPADHECH